MSNTNTRNSTSSSSNWLHLLQKAYGCSTAQQPQFASVQAKRFHLARFRVSTSKAGRRVHVISPIAASSEAVLGRCFFLPCFLLLPSACSAPFAGALWPTSAPGSNNGFGWSSAGGASDAPSSSGLTNSTAPGDPRCDPLFRALSVMPFPSGASRVSWPVLIYPIHASGLALDCDPRRADPSAQSNVSFLIPHPWGATGRWPASSPCVLPRAPGLHVWWRAAPAAAKKERGPMMLCSAS